MHFFYTPDIEADNQSFRLSEEESKHAIRVLRLGTGSHIQLVDGRGNFFQAEIIDPHPKRVSVRVVATHPDDTACPYRLHIAIAPTKNIDRLEWFVEKSTEIGIQRITPIICDRSERKEVKRERLEKVAIAAMKQSLKARLPKIDEAVSFQTFLSRIADSHSFKLIAHCGDGEKTYMREALQSRGHYLVMIGPEGDFTESEIRAASAVGALALSLGQSRLRTETAGIVACAEVSILNRV